MVSITLVLHRFPCSGIEDKEKTMAGADGVHNLLVKAAPASADIFTTGIHMSRLIKEGQSMEMAQVMIWLCTIQVGVRVRYTEGY
jgi:hypothetical protein